MERINLKAQLISLWNIEEKSFTWLISNLDRDDFSLSEMSRTYRLRWQVKLLFRGWKPYANLRRFDTGNGHLAEGSIWTSIAAGLLKRLLVMMCKRSRMCPFPAI
ncbi:Uncharacterised protein [BD1-7 clade bacterium]|uniref:Transposase IS4-like domain-containing protein n=1 Tax=BD1-7 clade bacterium TaxID=2029982 RepID=A0A5S9PG41_9GAMM|nr:Uncharacterised protein [BD1-7 clade bacterium]